MVSWSVKVVLPLPSTEHLYTGNYFSHVHVGAPFSVASLKTIPDFFGTVVLDYICNLCGIY